MQAVIDWKPAPSEYRACLLMMLLFALEVKFVLKIENNAWGI